MVSRRERFVESSNSYHHLQLTKWSCSTSCVISQSVNFSPIFVIQFRTNKTPAEQCRAAGYIHLLATSPPTHTSQLHTDHREHSQDGHGDTQERIKEITTCRTPLTAHCEELSIYELRCHVVMIFRAQVSSDLVRVCSGQGWQCSARVDLVQCQGLHWVEWSNCGAQ